MRDDGAGDRGLAEALVAGDPRATAEFLATYSSVLHGIARRLGVRHDVDDAVQRLLVAILVGVDGAPPKIASYRGSGSLSAWVRAVSTRHMIDQRRRASARPDVVSPGPGLDEAMLARSAGMTDAIGRSRHAAAVRVAVAEGFASLTPRARNLLRQASYHGLGVDELGALYRVHRATAARWLQRARLDLHEHATRSLVEATGVAPDEARSILAAMSHDGVFALPSMLPAASELEPVC